MKTLDNLKKIILNFEASDDEEEMERINTELVRAIPLKKDLGEILSVINQFNNKLIRIHLLCLLVNPEQKALIKALQALATEANDYIDLATALAGLKLAKIPFSESDLLHLNSILPKADLNRATDEINERFEYYLALKKASN